MNKKETINEVKEWVKSILLALLITLPILLVARTTQVDGKSMEPTLKDRDILISEKISVLKKDFYRGEIVIFKAGKDMKDNYIKRVIGLPNDVVEIKDGFVYVNNKKLNEDYLKQGTYTETDMKVTVPADSLFVLGDNRPVSDDSRYLGCISIDRIKYRAYYRVYPLNNLNKLN